MNRSNKLRKFAGFCDEIPTAEQVYEYMSRYSCNQFSEIINSTLNTINKKNRGIRNRFIVDATPSACDFNIAKQYIT